MSQKAKRRPADAAIIAGGIKIKYVLGLCFSFEKDKLVLIRKTKPAWQAGMLNGIGGKVEPGESYIDAMVREFEEETGVPTDKNGWRYFCEMEGAEFIVKCFCIFSQEAFEASETREEEEVLKIDVDEVGINHRQSISNLRWLIELARDENHGGNPPVIHAAY